MIEFDITDALAMAADDEGRSRAEAVGKDHAAALSAVMREAARIAEAKYRLDHPSAINIGTTAEIRSYVKRPKGFGMYAVQMVDRFLADPTSLTLSNRDL